MEEHKPPNGIMPGGGCRQREVFNLHINAQRLGRLEHLVLTHNGMFGDVAMELAKVGRIVVTLLGVSW